MQTLRLMAVFFATLTVTRCEAKPAKTPRTVLDYFDLLPKRFFEIEYDGVSRRKWLQEGFNAHIPVLNFDYAAQIARDWNTKDPVSGFAGFVTRFEIDDEYAAKFAVQTVGTRGRHDELWVLAEELGEFNSHILGEIEVVAAFYGDDFAGKRRFEATI